jgi:glycosyltransferase involved in cell wall biosynthesis
MGVAPRIEVLLATYNGAKFIREQIESLLTQDYDNLTVLARDDASADGTPDILREYERRYPNRFKLVDASPINTGFLNNFLCLVRASTAPYVCFCDQDDIWLPDKVSKTKAVLNELEQRWGSDIPLLVFTDLRVVDEDLNILHPSFWKCMNIDPRQIHNFSRLLACTVVTGCTMMSNRRLLDLASVMPKGASVHDRWIGLLAAAMGRTAFVREQTVLYRQHGRNAIGLGKRGVPRTVRQRIRDFPASARSQVKVWQAWQADAAALIRIHGTELPPGIRRLLEAFVRCESSDSRLGRLATYLSHIFYPPGILSKFVIASYLWLGRAEWSQRIERG